MIIQIRDIAYHLISNNKSASRIPIIFLHGFCGSVMDWEAIMQKINNRCYAIDLIGHGKTTAPEDIKHYNTDGIIADIYDIITELNLDNFILAGYSMGGRAALAHTLKYPRRVKGLILESTTPGIEGRNERIERMQSDDTLADLIRSNGMEFFTDYWMNLPLFASQKKLPPDILQQIRQRRLNNSISGIANMLSGFSTGRMTSYWTRLKEIKCKALLISGAMDEKYSEICSQMRHVIPSAKHISIPSCGHNTHLERPDIFIDLINEFIKE